MQGWFDSWNAILVIHRTIKIKEKNLAIFSRSVEKGLVNIQHLFMTKNWTRTRERRGPPRSDRRICKKPTANIALIGERLFFPDIWNQAIIVLLLLTLNTALEAISTATNKKKNWKAHRLDSKLSPLIHRKHDCEQRQSWGIFKKILFISL